MNNQKDITHHGTMHTTAKSAVPIVDHSVAAAADGDPAPETFHIQSELLIKHLSQYFSSPALVFIFYKQTSAINKQI